MSPFDPAAVALESRHTCHSHHFDVPALSLSREQQTPGYIEEKTYVPSDASQVDSGNESPEPDPREEFWRCSRRVRTIQDKSFSTLSKTKEKSRWQQARKETEQRKGISEEHTPDRVAAGVGGCAPAAAREGEGLDPRP